MGTQAHRPGAAECAPRKLDRESPVLFSSSVAETHPLSGRWLAPDRQQCTENAIRPFVLDRRAWFCDTVHGAQSSANLYSLIETAKAFGHEPYYYLRHVFTELPKATSLTDIEALLPFSSPTRLVAYRFNASMQLSKRLRRVAVRLINDLVFLQGRGMPG